MTDTTGLQQLFANALACVGQGDYQQAAALYQRATEIEPTAFSAWCNLAAMRLELRQTAEATAAARQAIALKHDFGPAWANLGDALRMTRGQGDASFEAYRRAAALMPNSPQTLNKLGASLHLRSRFQDAATILRRAVSLAPGYREARVNLVTTLMSLQREEELREVLTSGTQLPDLPAAARGEWQDALKLLDRNLRMQPQLERAVAQNDPEPVLALEGSEPDEQPADDALVETIRAALPSVGRIGDRFSPWRPELADLCYAVEAHFSAHLGETVEAIETTRRWLSPAVTAVSTSGTEALDAKQRDALRYYQLCRHFRAVPGGDARDPISAGGWLRFLHAQMTWHRPETTPGQFKIVPNSVTVNPSVIRTPPAQVAGTLNAVCRLSRESAAPGPVRAALIYFAVADIHPFPDGNGRLGRWLMNYELQAAGFAPVVCPDVTKPAFGQALWAVRRDHDFGPFVAWLADCNAYTQELIGRLAVR